MSINFMSPAVFVNNIEVSRIFYEEKLGQEVEMDAGQYVMFKGGLSIWQYQSAYQVIFRDPSKKSIPDNRESFELYFETFNLEKVWESVASGEVKVLHPIKEHSWGQRGFRDILEYYGTTERYNVHYGGLVELVVNAMVNLDRPFLEFLDGEAEHVQ